MYINFHSIISIYNTRQLLLNQLLLSIACREGGGGDFSNGLTYCTKDTKQHTHYVRAP